MNATWIPSERTESRDPATGRTVMRWTASAAKDQHLYFTSPTVTADNRWLVIISERTGSPNLFAIERVTGRLRQLTHNTRGLRLGYCYPTGGPIGFSKSTPALDPVRARAFAVIDDHVWRCDINSGNARAIAPLPEPGMTAFTHVSPDGRWLCVPVTNPVDPFREPAQIQAEQMERGWSWVASGKLRTKLWLFDTETGAARLWTELPFWVTHVQFDPTHAMRAIGNSEGLWQHQHVIPRIWCIDANGKSWPLFTQPPEEQCGHENFDDAGHIVYHSCQNAPHFLAQGGQHSLMRRAWNGDIIEQIDVSGLQEHHAIPAAADYLVDSHDGLIYRVSSQSRTPLCRHDSGGWDDQDNHVHPVPSGHNSVIFTSRRAGMADVYEVLL